jgi:mannose-6-phosphate isomerase-like protein (cupin superfamily)
MSYNTATTDDVESRLPDDKGGMWFLKDALNTDHLGFTILELAPNEQGKEHDHGHDNQEEIYYVESGHITVHVANDTVELTEGDAIRIDPATSRQIVNGETASRLVLVGAPAR